ncbi:hypothetical protein FGF1_03260 [Flavobacteriaceae bacterium GF1]
MRIINRIPWKALSIAVVFMGIGFVLGAKSGHNITWLTTEKTLNSKTVSDAVNKPTTAVTTNNKVELKKNKGNLVFAPTTEQSYCDSLLQVFIDTTSVREFRKQKRINSE